MIDEAIGILGDFGEVRLIVEKGRLRFLITQRSYDMLKIQPGSLVEDFKKVAIKYPGSNCFLD
jgi:hypothetical protein